MDVILAVVCLGLLTIALLIAGAHFRIPGIVCFLIIGILAGPYALSILTDQSTIETIGEIGVILLLFAIGLEFSFERLLGAWRTVIIGGCLQLITTIIAASAVMHFVAGIRFTEAVFFGFLVSLSSTAIVMKVLQERGEVETLKGRTLLGILIFQDLAIIPMILITPFLIGSGGASYESLPLQVVKVVGILAILVISARWVVPWFLMFVARQKSRELFIFSVAALCFIIAWLTNAAGLSYSLGAFVAGLIIGESEFSLDAVSNIIPFRDVFSAIFFISIGMLLDPGVIVTHADIVFTIIAVILGVKVITGMLAATVLGLSARVAVFVGLALAQIGEFSFVLAKSGLSTDLIGEGPYQFFLAGAIITMALTPFTMNAAPSVYGILHRLFPGRISNGDETEKESPPALTDHLIIVGYGMTGRSVAGAAEIAGIPTLAIDMDPDVVRAERESGGTRLILYGDATHPEVLAHAGIRHARALIVVIPDENVIPVILHHARELAPDIEIVVRTRHVKNIRQLIALGADEVIPEEFETAVRIFSRVLARYGRMPEEEAGLLAGTIRDKGHRLLGRTLLSSSRWADEIHTMAVSMNIHAFRITESSPAAGRTLKDLRDRTGRAIRILAIRRGETTLPGPDPDLLLQPGDLLILLATDEDLKRFRTWIERPGIREERS